MALSEQERRARIALAVEHIRLENGHDLSRVMDTFGPEPFLAVNSERHTGRENVRALYAAVFAAFPDLQIEVRHQHVTTDAVIFEAILRGTHGGTWEGVPATGRRVEITDCAVVLFDESGKLAGERVYLDEALLLRQLGVLSY